MKLLIESCLDQLQDIEGFQILPRDEHGYFTIIAGKTKWLAYRITADTLFDALVCAKGRIDNDFRSKE